MTPTALAQRYIRRASRDLSDNPLGPTGLDGSMEIMTLALLTACTELPAASPSGFDRSATLARAAEAKRAEGPPSL